MKFPEHMPRDPFANDPNDPANLFDPEEPMEPLTEDDRMAICEELELINYFQAVMEPRGFRGVCSLCEDCEEMHFFDWEIMKANLQGLLVGELPPVHEPSAQPSPSDYAPWDYCVGFCDGFVAFQNENGLL